MYLQPKEISQIIFGRVLTLKKINKMIDNGCGIITIAQKNQPIFFEKLIKYYETNDNKDLKEWLHKTSIDGINLQNIIQKNYIMFFLLKKKLITDK